MDTKSSVGGGPSAIGPPTTTRPSASPSQSSQKHLDTNNIHQTHNLAFCRELAQQRVQLVLHTLRSYRDSSSRDESDERRALLPLTKEEYEEFQWQLEADALLDEFVSKKVRVNWDSKKCRLELIMPTCQIHDNVAYKIAKAIDLKLESINTSEQDDEIKTAARAVENWGAANIKSDTGDDKQPDFQFGITKANPPGLAGEVSYKNKYKYDEERAAILFTSSGWSTKIVIIVNIWPNEDSTVSVYRRKMQTVSVPGGSKLAVDLEEVFARRPFRRVTGAYIDEETSLSLSLNDCMSGNDHQKMEEVDLGIKFRDLADIVNNWYAEEYTNTPPPDGRIDIKNTIVLYRPPNKR